MNPSLNVLAVAVALGAIDSFGSCKLRPSKEHCAKCFDKIPPGKSGRKCEKCRNNTGVVMTAIK